MQRVIDFSKRAVKLARSNWYTEHVTIAGENFSVKVYGSYVQVIRHNETGVQDGHHCRTKKEAQTLTSRLKNRRPCILQPRPTST